MKWKSPKWPAVTYVLVTIVQLIAPAQIINADSCLFSGETVYRVGENAVKPPNLRMERKSPEKPIRVNVPFVLEVVINSLGKICQVHAVKPSDRKTAEQLEHFVIDNFRFSAATKNGKPVPVRINIVFNAQGGIQTR